jgi:hypothetical protein
VETEVFANTLSLWSLSFVKINDIPSLGSASVVWPDTYWVTFNIFTTIDIESLVALPVDELVVLISENLPPS